MSWELVGVGAFVVIVGAYFWFRRESSKKKDAHKTPDEIYPLW